MLRRSVLAGAAVALAGCSDVFAGPEPDAAETAIHNRINEERAAAGVPDVGSDAGLQTVARAHSDDMAERDFYAHENPDGETPGDRVACAAGENLHRGEIGRMKNPGSDKTWSTTAVDELAGFVIEGWVRSDSHYQNMTNSRWSRVGVGVAIVDGGFFVTAVFC